MAFNKYCCNVLALTMHGNNSLPITYKNPPYDPFICQLPLPPTSLYPHSMTLFINPTGVRTCHLL